MLQLILDGPCWCLWLYVCHGYDGQSRSWGIQLLNSFHLPKTWASSFDSSSFFGFSVLVQESYIWLGHGMYIFLTIWSSSTVHAEPLNYPVVGIINGKFDNGYFVTVTVGSEIFHGVLFNMPPLEAASTSLAIPNNAIVPYVAPRPQRRRRRGKRNRDPGHPKPNRSAYNFFFAEKHSKLKLLYPQREREFSKMIGESWNKLTQEERMVNRIL